MKMNARESRILFIGIALVALMVGCCHALAFTSHTRHRIMIFPSRPSAISFTMHHRSTPGSLSTLTMKDKSSAYWFQTGDFVRVVDDVVKAGASLKGRVGNVVEVWAKCEVDPTCCCAEQVDPGMAVRVEFQGTERNSSESGSSFMHYFAEEELIKVKEEEEPTGSVDKKDHLPFDGMSCTAFKLDQLRMGEQARRIAAYGQSQNDKSSLS